MLGWMGLLLGETMNNDEKIIRIGVLRDCFEDEIEQLQLLLIRDAQAPRFEALKGSHPEIYKDFMKARNLHHELLLKNRRKRVITLTELIEN